jgi:uncharacterized membrane protein
MENNTDINHEQHARKNNWHQQHKEHQTFGQKIADVVANGMGSWSFIIIQTVFVIIWMSLNVVGWCMHWDIYPFILLNLLFSTQAAYAAPIIMMAQNRQSERDRFQATEDYLTNVKAKKEIEQLQKALARIENDKLNEILAELKAMKEKGNS